jgi:hypothetical protein
MGSYIPEDGIVHSHCRENLKSYTDTHSFHSLPVYTGGGAAVSLQE